MVESGLRAGGGSLLRRFLDRWLMAGGITAINLLCSPLVMAREVQAILLGETEYTRMRVSGGSTCLGECLGRVLLVSQMRFTRVGGLVVGHNGCRSFWVVQAVCLWTGSLRAVLAV
jgi:hypothetical protein